jgi:hypothetical protein
MMYRRLLTQQKGLKEREQNNNARAIIINTQQHRREEREREKCTHEYLSAFLIFYSSQGGIPRLLVAQAAHASQ